MVIFWGGTKGREKTVSSGQFLCPNCQSQCPYIYKNIVKQYSAYFIPLHEKKLDSYVECQVCKQAFKPEVLDSESSVNQEAEALFHKGKAAFEQGQYEEAIRFFDSSLELEPDNPAPLYNKGTTLCGLGNYEEALSCLDRVIELDPEDTAALQNKGACLNGLGRYKDAIILFDNILKVDPGNLAAMTSKGVSLAYLSRYKEAISLFEKVLKRDPHNAEALRVKGLVEQELKK